MEKQIIHFVTGNKGKFSTLKKYADAAGIVAIQEGLHLIEPQGTIREISRSKAEQAFALLRKPLIVNDAGMCVNELHGFPGPYVKYIVETIGVDGMLRLAEPLQERRCYFIGVLSFIDETGITQFEDITEGRLAMEIDRNPEPLHLWSDMERIFIPEGMDKPLSAFTEADYSKWHQELESRNVFGQFVRWLKQKG